MITRYQRAATALARQGCYSQSDIARILDCHRSTVMRALRKNRSIQMGLAHQKTVDMAEKIRNFLLTKDRPITASEIRTSMGLPASASNEVTAGLGYAVSHRRIVKTGDIGRTHLYFVQGTTAKLTLPHARSSPHTVPAQKPDHLIGSMILQKSDVRILLELAMEANGFTAEQEQLLLRLTDRVGA